MVVGSEAQVLLPWLAAPLQQALAQQRSHALLVQAADGVGALQFMLTLAQAWLCEGHAPSRPCGRCVSCHLAQSRTHPDLLVLLPEALQAEVGWGGSGSGEGEGEGGQGHKGKKKPSKQIKIDEVRAAIDWIVQTSSRGRAKVLVLHPAEAMNLQSASALLKTLEEPPGQARIVLSATDAGHLMPTVRSRCQQLRLAAPAVDEAVAWLGAQHVPQAAVLLAAAGGAPLAAHALANAGIDAPTWLDLPRRVSNGHWAAFAGWPIPRVVDTLQKICHDAMVVASGGAPRYFTPQAVPAGASLPALIGWARSLGRVARHAEHSWNEGLLVESLVCEGHACWQEATPKVLIAHRPLDTLKR